MAWIIHPAEIADEQGRPTGRWRMVAKSDGDGGGPYGDPSHDHSSASAAMECERCDEYTSRWAGMPTRKRQKELDEERELREYKRLHKKFGNKALTS